MTKKTLLSVCISFFSYFFVNGQVSQKFYSCDFEDEAENALWECSSRKPDPLTQYINRWYIGEATNNGGKKSLYISANEGQTAGYIKVTGGTISLAWRDLLLEEGDYDMSFDWKCLGDSDRNVLRIAWVDVEKYDSDMHEQTGNDNLGEWYQKSVQFFNIDSVPFFYNSSAWQRALCKLHSDGKKHRLVFVFCTNYASIASQPGGCVDNIEIRRNICGAPTNLTAKTTGSLVKFSWLSTAESFNLKFRNYNTGEMIYANNITRTSYQMNLNYGIYETYIRCICHGDSSVWYSFPPVIIYDNTCINYLDLNDSNCWYARHTTGDSSTLRPQKIDHGHQSKLSYHTIHYQADEYDARTFESFRKDMNNRWVSSGPLKVVPDGELASVRLGSWVDARVARLTYDFTVDAEEASTLLIKYALVLQMSGHDEKDQPRLTIDVVDPQTDAILNACTSIDLVALKEQSNMSGDTLWNIHPVVKLDASTPTDINWRDWSTIGLNLKEFAGRTIRVKITAYGCGMSAHYSYAYLVVKCISSQIEGLQCGDTPTTYFNAPDGFKYRWYKISDPGTIISEERKIDVDFKDTTTYKVDVINKAKGECFFTLSASAMPRYPIPDFTYQLIQKDCKSYIQLTNNSHIRTKDLNTNIIYDTNKKPERVEWDFDGLEPQAQDGNIPWNPLLEVPPVKKTYNISLTAGIGLCDSTMSLRIRTPRVGPDTVIEKSKHCKSSRATFKGRPITKDTAIREELYNQAGCDSLHITEFMFLETIRDTIHAEIGEGDTFIFANKKYYQTVTDSAIYIPHAGNCDSIEYLELIVNEHLLMQIIEIDTLCADVLHPFTIKVKAVRGIPNGYNLRFDNLALRQGFEDIEQTLEEPIQQNDTIIIYVNMPSSARPDWYNFVIHFTSEKNGTDSIISNFELKYPQSIIQQLWDDVLGFLGAKRNGGYEIVECQWYKNDMIIPGADGGYYYEDGGLDLNATYAAAFKRAGETYTVKTCNFTPSPFTGDKNIKRDMIPSDKIKKIILNGKLFFIIRNKMYNALGGFVKYIE